MYLKLPLLLLMTLFFLPAMAQNKRDELNSYFSMLSESKQLNGNILVAEKGKILYQKSFGFARLDNQLPNTDSSSFTLASVAKTLTSAAVLQLKEKGKLKLDDALIKYFPDFPYADLTIRHLLSHTSGLPDYDLYEDEMKKQPGKIFTIQDLLPALKNWKKPLHFKAGEKWEYSNTNFCLLALLIEKVSGISFQKYMYKFIFLPAKMNHTYFQADPLEKNNKNRTINYEYPWLFSTEMEPADNIKRNYWRSYNASGFVGQGNIMTTTGDMLNFDEALYSYKILKKITEEEAFKPVKLNNGSNANADNGTGKASYGLGWFIFTDTSMGKIVWHSGGAPGGLSIFMRNISKHQTVVGFDNTFNKGLYRYGLNAMNILNDKAIATRRQSLTPEYNLALLKNGPDAAFIRLLQLKTDSVHYYLSEDDMNELGLQMLYAANFSNHKELALEILKLNVLLFPESFNTYDSYGEALANTGKKEEAIYMYKKSLKLNPGSEGGKKAIEELQKK